MSSADTFLVIIAIILLIAIIITGSIDSTLHEIKTDTNELIEILEDISETTTTASNDLLFANQSLTDDLQSENEQLRKIIIDLETKETDTTCPVESDRVETDSEISKSRLPEDIATNMFRCEPIEIFDKYDEETDEPIYKSIFHPKSDQYKLQQECFTDAKTGIRFFNKNGTKYLCAALAGAYGTTIGDTWQVTLQSGYSFNIIMADFKHPIDNIDPNDFGDNDTNYDGEPCINIIEFVCDLKISPKAVIDAGTMSAFEEFGGLYGDGGNIISMKYLGRKWEA